MEIVVVDGRPQIYLLDIRDGLWRIDFETPDRKPGFVAAVRIPVRRINGK